MSTLAAIRDAHVLIGKFVISAWAWVLARIPDSRIYHYVFMYCGIWDKHHQFQPHAYLDGLLEVRFRWVGAAIMLDDNTSAVVTTSKTVINWFTLN